MKSTETPPKTFSELLSEGNRFTDRDFMKALGVGHPALKQRKADPSLFTMGELLTLAKLLGQPINAIVKVVLAEIESKPSVEQQLERAAEQVVGRKYFPRASKKEKPAPDL